SIRSVTTNPPTMFSVASVVATTPRATSMAVSAWPVTMIAPTRITPWMAFAPDISGVCSVVGTLEITSCPVKPESTKMVSRGTGSGTASPPALPGPSAPPGPSGGPEQRAGRVGQARGRRVPERAVVGDAAAGDDLVVEIQRDTRTRVVRPGRTVRG